MLLFGHGRPSRSCMRCRREARDSPFGDELLANVGEGRSWRTGSCPTRFRPGSASISRPSASPRARLVADGFIISLAIRLVPPSPHKAGGRLRADRLGLRGRSPPSRGPGRRGRGATTSADRTGVIRARFGVSDPHGPGSSSIVTPTPSIHSTLTGRCGTGLRPRTDRIRVAAPLTSNGTRVEALCVQCSDVFSPAVAPAGRPDTVTKVKKTSGRPRFSFVPNVAGR